MICCVNGLCAGLQLVCALALLAAPACAQAEPRTLDRVVPNDAFGPGEHLDFSVGYGIVKAGTATMQVRGISDSTGRPVYRIMTTATSNSFFDSFYPVRDTMRSFVDAQGLFSWRYEKHMREGDYRKHQVVDFLQREGLAVDGEDSVEIPVYAQDVLSALYYVRTQPLEVGQSLRVPNLTDRKNYDLEVRILARETVKTPAGEFTCLKVEPLLQAAGIFKHEGRITVWMTDDRLHMPVLMKSRVVVGAIHAELTSYRLGELWEN
jgi:hypothetical protein